MANEAQVFSDNICIAPCWFGLTPGLSTEQAIEDLLGSDNILAINVSEDTTKSECQVIRLGVQRKEAGVDIRDVHIEEGRITFIESNWDVTLSLKQVVARFGSPEYAKAIQTKGPHGDFYELEVYYPARGLAFILHPDQQDAGLISPNMPVSRVQYYPPGNMLSYLVVRETCWKRSDNATLLAQDELRLIQPWPGYGKVQVIEMQ